jgi:uncharacterized protein (DUF58 family)
METTELLKKVRKIEIKARGLSNDLFSGEYHSAFKGRGMSFSEVREYQYGDDIRAIDWNVTARLNHPYIKVFEEERELTVMLLVDISASKNFGSKNELKKSRAIEIAAVIAFSAINNNDKIGLILFSDKVEKYIPPRKGKSHVLRIIRDLIEFTPENKGTNIGESLKFLNNVIRKRCTAFLLSDFKDKDFESPMKIAGKKHDLIAIGIRDEREHILPNAGLVKVRDAETDEVYWIDTNDDKVRKIFEAASMTQKNDVLNVFRKCNVDNVFIDTEKPYTSALMTLFKKRGTR